MSQYKLFRQVTWAFKPKPTHEGGFRRGGGGGNQQRRGVYGHEFTQITLTLR